MGGDVSTPQSEQAHDAKLQQLAGTAAAWVFAAPRRYPRFDADQIADVLDQAGVVCSVQDGPIRALVFRAEGEVHALVTDYPRSGSRRRYRAIRGGSVVDVVTAVRSLWR